MICQAVTAKGSPCTRVAKVEKKGRHYCRQHANPEVTGKRPGCTEDLVAEIARYLKAGVTVRDTCGAVGIAESTFYTWQERGEADLKQGLETRHSEFVKKSTHARAVARAAAVTHIRSAMGGDWRAAAWFLERADSENWGKRERQEITGANGGPIVSADANDPEVRKLAAKLLRRRVEATDDSA